MVYITPKAEKYIEELEEASGEWKGVFNMRGFYPWLPGRPEVVHEAAAIMTSLSKSVPPEVWGVIESGVGEAVVEGFIADETERFE